MATLSLQEIVDLAPRSLKVPSGRMWTSYDAEADVLYISFRKPSHADDSGISDEGIIVRYQEGEVVGVTILNASDRVANRPS